MQRNSNYATWLGTLLGVLAAVALNLGLAHAVEQTGPVVDEFHYTYPLAANGRVELENINGAVHISAWDQNQVKVDAIKRADDAEGLKRMEIQVDAHPDSISIRTHYRSEGENWGNHHYSSVEYTITVPRNARLDEIKLINGPLDITGVRGQVHASSINGKVSARGLGNEVELSTVNGPLEVTCDQLANRVELQSVNGPIALTLPSDAKANVEASTVHGHIENDFGIHVIDHHIVGHEMHGQLGSGGTEIRLNNVNGPIDVRRANDGRAMSPVKNEGGGDEDEI